MILHIVSTYRLILMVSLCGFLVSTSTLVASEKNISVETCSKCHQITLDTNHGIGCSTCHAGNPTESSQGKSHTGLINSPSHPDRTLQTCESCHEKQNNQFHLSVHMTMKNMVNSVRRSFGATSDLNSLTEVPTHDTPSTSLELVDDMLRRRCLRCHLYYRGDSYPSISHGTGCAACHLKYIGNSLQSHTFIKLPDDTICLGCHYGNTVGADYYGLYEQDYNWEYRTPFVFFDEKRPYGVETHQLTPDIHQQKGLACIDCHIGSDHNGSGVHSNNFRTIFCRTCHQAEATAVSSFPHITIQDSTVTLTGRLNGNSYTVPQLQHTAHFDSSIKANCTVCHAQWSFNDKGTHLIRLDQLNPETWAPYSVQGSSEVENQIDIGEESPVMSDKLSGKSKPGIWLKGYEQRRWETVVIGSSQGVLEVMRPILDIHISYRNAKGKVIIDSQKGAAELKGYRPYTPHTIGKAGIFFKQLLKDQLTEDNKQSAAEQ